MSPSARALALVLAVAALLLAAGCLGTEEDAGPAATEAPNASNAADAPPDAAAPEPNETETDGTAGADARTPTAYRFAGENVTRREIWDGAFEGEEAVQAAAAIDEGPTHRYVLEDLPTDVPLTLDATLRFAPLSSWVPVGVVLGDLDLRLEPGDAEVHALSRDADYGDAYEKHLEGYLVARNGTPPALVVEAKGANPGLAEPEDPAGIPYSLRADLASVDRAVPPGLPVEVPLPEDPEEVRLRSLGPSDKTTTAMVWNPAAGTVAHVEVAPEPTRLPDLGGPGQRLVLIAQPADPIEVRAEGPPPGPLTPASLTTVELDTRTVAPLSEASWSFPVDQAPVQVGVTVRPEDPVMAREGSATGPSINGTVASPSGTVLDFQETGVTAWRPSPLAWWSPPGGDHHVAGEYEVVVRFDGALATEHHVTPALRFVEPGPG